LSQAVVSSCEFEPWSTVVELGPGTGAFTELLLERLDERGRLLALEISDTNIDVLRRRFPRCRAIHDSAENLPRHLSRRRADCIISGLAWGNMLPSLSAAHHECNREFAIAERAVCGVRLRPRALLSNDTQFPEADVPRICPG
jgi:phospholipid N-methyltransferase